jgi:hypothetical protein
MNVSQYTPGTYFLTISNGNSSVVKQITIHWICLFYFPLSINTRL